MVARAHGAWANGAIVRVPKLCRVRDRDKAQWLWAHEAWVLGAWGPWGLGRTEPGPIGAWDVGPWGLSQSHTSTNPKPPTPKAGADSPG